MNKKIISWLTLAAVLALGLGYGIGVAVSNPKTDDKKITQTANPLEKLNKVEKIKVSVNNGSNHFEKKNYSKIFGIDGGEDKSPQVSWETLPEGTKSVAVSMYDVDASTESGFWHWMVVDIPASNDGLAEDAGNLTEKRLPTGAKAILGDAGEAGYIGAAPPAGETHDYYIVVTALDTDKLDIDATASPAFAEFSMASHTLGRGYVRIKG